MTALRTIVAGDCAAGELGRLAATLLEQEVGAPTLLVARLAEDALLLGRHQRAASAVDLAAARARGLAVARRAGGGKTLHAASGSVGILLAVPPGGWSEPLAPDRVLNRCVRGLLRGLTAAGAAGGAFYFGRDFVSWRRQQVAAVSQDGAPGGTMLFEAVVAAAAPLALPEGLSRYPEHADPRAPGPPHASLPAGFDRIAEAVIEAWSSALGATPSAEPARPEPGDPLAPPLEEDDGDLAASGLFEIPIGFLEAQVRMGGDRIAEARLRGDFIAPAFAVAGLEAALVGRRLELAEIAPMVDAAFTRPPATIVGVRELRVVADALLACRA